MTLKLILFIFGLSLLIFGLDFFTVSGTYFFLDTLFYPKQFFVPFFDQTLYWHFTDLGTYIFGYKLFTKICFLLIFFTGCLLGIQVSNIISRLFKSTDGIKNSLLACLSISFIVLNPFIYERFITQTHIVLGIFFIGLGIASLINFLLYDKPKQLYLSAMFLGLSLSIFPHSIIFLFIIAFTSLGFFLRKFSIRSILLSVFIVIGINLNWVIGHFFSGTGNGIEKISTFNFQNIEVFQSNSLSGLGIEITNFLLYGFWGEKYNHLYTPDMMNQKWYIAGGIILAIVFWGVITLYKYNRKITLYFITLLSVSYILSLGISSPLFSGINMFLYNTVPYYIGMREPQKLTGLVMIVYSFFFLSGVYGICESIGKYNLGKYLHPYILHPSIGVGLLFLIIASWSPNVLFGFNGQLKITDYPQELFEVRDLLLSEDIHNGNSLILPWHTYIACPWTHGKVISNITQTVLLPAQTISSDNIEVGTLYTNNKENIVSQKVEDFLKNKDYGILKRLGVTDIIMLDRCADFSKYTFLKDEIEKGQNSSLNKTFSSEFISIYNIK